MSILSLRHYRFMFAASSLILGTTASHAQTYTVLHNFAGTDGCCANYPSVMGLRRRAASPSSSRLCSDIF